MAGPRGLKDWIIRQGLEAAGQESFLEGLAPRLAAAMPLDRLTIAVPSLDPNIRGVNFTWEGGRVLFDTSAHGAQGEATFRTSPIHFANESGLKEKSWNLASGEDVAVYPLFARLAADGYSHYALKLLPYPNEPQIVGMALSLATRHAAGFDARHDALVDALLPAIGLTVYRIELSRVARETLRVYVGDRTSDRILAGSIHRGDGEAIHAAILFADLKGFTALSQERSAPDMVAILNQRFDILDAPIRAYGGEILKFMGDGLLAVFPLSQDEGRARDACLRAREAAREALAANDGLNRACRGDGAPAIGLDVALHLGEVFYGNIGASRRLDFTVIGPAVNMASRIEELCDVVDRNLLVSRDFALRCGDGAVALGRFVLKGVAEPQDVFGYDAAS